MSVSMLEQRIADALKADDVKSDDLADLIVETEVAAADASAAAERARERALDPSVIDAAARTAMQDSEFLSQRLRAAIPRLQARLDEITAQEYASTWRADYAEVEAVRDALAAELREVYSPFVARITDLFTRIKACDREVSRINGSAPSGVPLRLREVELAARNLEGFTTAAPSIAEELRLRHWEQPNELAWPPPKPFDPAWFAPAPFNRSRSAEWWKVKEEEARAVRERLDEAAEEEEAKQRESWHGPRWWEVPARRRTRR